MRDSSIFCPSLSPSGSKTVEATGFLTEMLGVTICCKIVPFVAETNEERTQSKKGPVQGWRATDPGFALLLVTWHAYFSHSSLDLTWNTFPRFVVSQTAHRFDPLPEGWFYNGQKYVSLGGERSDTHPGWYPDHTVDSRLWEVVWMFVD